METSRALAIIKALGNGVDPHTGKVFPFDSPYQHPDTVRALFKAVVALESLQKREKRQKSLPENAGKRWGKDEDNQLMEQFDKGMSFKALSEKHGRTEGAVKSRLERLGKITLMDK